MSNPEGPSVVRITSTEVERGAFWIVRVLRRLMVGESPLTEDLEPVFEADGTLGASFMASGALIGLIRSGEHAGLVSHPDDDEEFVIDTDHG